MPLSHYVHLSQNIYPKRVCLWAVDLPHTPLYNRWVYQLTFHGRDEMRRVSWSRGFMVYVYVYFYSKVILWAWRVEVREHLTQRYSDRQVQNSRVTDPSDVRGTYRYLWSCVRDVTWLIMLFRVLLQHYQRIWYPELISRGYLWRWVWGIVYDISYREAWYQKVLQWLSLQVLRGEQISSMCIWSSWGVREG